MPMEVGGFSFWVNYPFILVCLDLLLLHEWDGSWINNYSRCHYTSEEEEDTTTLKVSIKAQMVEN